MKRLVLPLMALLLVSLACARGQPNYEATQISEDRAAIERLATEISATQNSSAPAEEPAVPPVEPATDAPPDSEAAPTVEPPTAEPAVRQKILLLTSVICNQIEGLAFESGVDFSLHYTRTDENDPRSRSAFQRALGQPDVRAVIYATNDPRAEELAMLANVRREGGRVLIVYDGYLSEHNGLLRDLFGVNVVATWIYSDVDYLPYESAYLPPSFNSFSVGVVSFNAERVVMPAYLTVNQPGVSEGYGTDSNGVQRLLYYAADNVIFMPAMWRTYTGQSEPAYFFCDGDIDLFENRSAAQAMLRMLSGD